MSDAAPSHPVVPTILISDLIYRDGVSGKHTILGVFSQIIAHGFPVQHPYMWVFITVTDVYREALIRVEIVEVAGGDGDEPIAHGELRVAAESPLVSAEFALPWPGIVFPRPGEYRVQAKHENVVLNEWRLLLFQVQTGDGHADARGPGDGEQPQGDGDGPT